MNRQGRERRERVARARRLLELKVGLCCGMWVGILLIRLLVR